MGSKLRALRKEEIENTGLKKLKRNAHLNFVKRILDPYAYPSIANKDGSKSTHLMLSGEAEGKGYAFPAIVQDLKTKKLQRLNADAAWKYAASTGELLEFKSPAEAEAFADGGYKKGTPMDPMLDEIHFEHEVEGDKTQMSSMPKPHRNRVRKGLTSAWSVDDGLK